MSQDSISEVLVENGMSEENNGRSGAEWSWLATVRHGTFRRYGFALAAFAATFVLRYELNDWMAGDVGFILFVPAVTVTTLIAGLAPGILTAFLSGIAIWYFFLSPFAGFAFTPASMAGIASYIMVVAITITLVHRLQGSIGELRAEIAERRRAERALTESANENEALFRLADRLNRANSLQEVFDVALETIVSALHCDRAAVLLLDDAGVMRYVGWRGLSPEYRRAAEGRSPWATDEREPQTFRVNDIDPAPVPELLKTAIKHEGIRALCIFPIAGTGKRIGRFVAYYNTTHVFSPNENELGLAIARQLGVSIEKKLAEERETLLRRETHHRIKNLFAVIQAVAARSFSGHQSFESARETFVGRIMALARADQQLNESQCKGANLKELLECELAPFAGRYSAEGADVLLDAKTVQNFSLALHELATNAAKYGAFSTADGTVRIGWTANGGHARLKLTWKEVGGPPVSPPTRSGFGTALLSATLGSARIEYAPDGLIYEAEIPVASQTVRPPAPAE